MAEPTTGRLTIIFDPSCPLCVRCRHWMELQPAYVNFEFLASTSATAQKRYGDVPWLGDELVVVNEHGEVWVGAAAFLVALWALRDWRSWSYRLSGTVFAPLAKRFFESISHKRHWIAGFLRHTECPDGHCTAKTSLRALSAVRTTYRRGAMP
ncbi:MAG: DUF393 domain-containing protein [Proteobacteria bacterium]|nr:DUF393 domain-containing protein [Pseudomonadota bacterium]